MPTRNTTKQGLAFSIDLVAAAIDVARPRGVARVNGRAWRPCEQRLYVEGLLRVWLSP
jgi:hypothetical protein